MNLSLRFLLPLSLVPLAGCAVLDLKKQDTAIADSGCIAVQVANPPTGVPVYVLAMDRTVLGATENPASGLACFVVPKSAVANVVAFADVNRNKRLDAGEPAGRRTGLAAMPLEDPRVQTAAPVVTLSSPPPADLVGLTVGAESGAAIRIAVGEVASLTDRRFAPAVGEEGLWKPDTALKAGNLGLFFTEPYDATRTPVVFVHGIGGSPQDFRTLLPRLDRTRFQAWFFTYPSGFRLSKASSALATLTRLAAQRHGITELHIVAHSMGGLVSRAGILQLDRGPVRVGRFVSISTPWAGHEAAASGVRALKYPVPSWIDMAPGSRFLKSLWAQRLPDGTRHWLIYGYDTKKLPWLTMDNDQVINERSALFIPAQEESVRVFGLPYDHEGILNARETAAKMNLYLTE